MAEKSFQTQVQELKFATFDLDGKEYQIRIPKPDVLAAKLADEADDNIIAAVRMELDWLLDQFPEEGVADELLERIKDPDDTFDMTLLREIVEWATEQGSGGRPTRRSSQSSSTPQRRGSSSRPSSPRKG